MKLMAETMPALIHFTLQNFNHSNTVSYQLLNDMLETGLPNENEKRFIAVLNKKVEPGRAMNALGHMTAGLAGDKEFLFWAEG